MLFPSSSNYSDIVKTLKECRKKLQEKGNIIIGIMHPAFDQYMQFGLLGKENIETKFEGYFKSGKKHLIYKKIDKNIVKLEDYHWTLSDYVKAIKEANLNLIGIDECSVDETLIDNKLFIKEKNTFPTYLVFHVKR